MSEQHLSGTWRVVQSTEPDIVRGATARIIDGDTGLRISSDRDGTVEVPWSGARISVASNGQVVIDTQRGTIWAEPLAGANSAQLVEAFAAHAGAPMPIASAARHPEFPAGNGRVLVLYRGDDDGSEVDPASLLEVIGADAVRRSALGWRLESMVGLPLRHAGQKVFGVEGSGYTTKAAIGCLYVQDGAAELQA